MLYNLMAIPERIAEVLKITGIGYVTIFAVILIIMGIVALLNLLNKFTDKNK